MLIVGRLIQGVGGVASNVVTLYVLIARVISEPDRRVVLLGVHGLVLPSSAGYRSRPISPEAVILAVGVQRPYSRCGVGGC